MFDKSPFNSLEFISNIRKLRKRYLASVQKFPLMYTWCTWVNKDTSWRVSQKSALCKEPINISHSSEYYLFLESVIPRLTRFPIDSADSYYTVFCITRFYSKWLIKGWGMKTLVACSTYLYIFLVNSTLGRRLSFHMCNSDGKIVSLVSYSHSRLFSCLYTHV